MINGSYVNSPMDIEYFNSGNTLVINKTNLSENKVDKFVGTFHVFNFANNENNFIDFVLLDKSIKVITIREEIGRLTNTDPDNIMISFLGRRILEDNEDLSVLNCHGRGGEVLDLIVFN